MRKTAVILGLCTTCFAATIPIARAAMDFDIPNPTVQADDSLSDSAATRTHVRVRVRVVASGGQQQNTAIYEKQPPPSYFVPIEKGTCKPHRAKRAEKHKARQMVKHKPTAHPRIHHKTPIKSKPAHKVAAKPRPAAATGVTVKKLPPRPKAKPAKKVLAKPRATKANPAKKRPVIAKARQAKKRPARVGVKPSYRRPMHRVESGRARDVRRAAHIKRPREIAANQRRAAPRSSVDYGARRAIRDLNRSLAKHEESAGKKYVHQDWLNKQGFVRSKDVGKEVDRNLNVDRAKARAHWHKSLWWGASVFIIAFIIAMVWLAAPITVLILRIVSAAAIALILAVIVYLIRSLIP